MHQHNCNWPLLKYDYIWTLREREQVSERNNEKGGVREGESDAAWITLRRGRKRYKGSEFNKDIVIQGKSQYFFFTNFM